MKVETIKVEKVTLTNDERNALYNAKEILDELSNTLYNTTPNNYLATDNTIFDYADIIKAYEIVNELFNSEMLELTSAS